MTEGVKAAPRIERGEYSPGYGRRQAIDVIRLAGHVELPATLELEISP